MDLVSMTKARRIASRLLNSGKAFTEAPIRDIRDPQLFDCLPASPRSVASLGIGLKNAERSLASTRLPSGTQFGSHLLPEGTASKRRRSRGRCSCALLARSTTDKAPATLDSVVVKNSTSTSAK
jgi:hypothetical protein